MSINMMREKRKRWSASGPAKTEAVERWTRYANAHNARIMQKYAKKGNSHARGV